MGISYGNAKTYLKDNIFFDSDDAKSTRMADIVINRALERVNTEHRWSYYHFLGRVQIVPTASGFYNSNLGSGIMEVGKNANLWDGPIAGQHVQDQGKLTEMTVSGVEDNKIILATHTPFTGSGDTTSGSYTVHYDVYPLPSGTRNISKVIDANQFGEIDYLEDDEFLNTIRRTGPQAGGPYAYTTTNHEISGQLKCIRVYPAPSASGTLDFFGYRYPAPVSTDATLLDWDGEKDGLLYAAMDYEGARLQFRGKDSAIESLREARTEYERAVRKYKQEDLVNLDMGGLARGVGYGLKSFPTNP